MEKQFYIHASQAGKIMSPAKKQGELSATCKSYLHEWYAGEKEEIFSKYILKGNIVENDLIEFMAEVLGLGFAEKNTLPAVKDEYFIGTPDVILDSVIVDVKAPFNIKSLHESSKEINEDYEWQGQVYMHLYNKKEFVLFYGLMDTPAAANYGKDVSYQHLDADKRWCAFNFKYDANKISDLQFKVIQCRKYLDEYDTLIRSKLGNIQIK